MAEATPEPRRLLTSMSDAFARGDSAAGERLLERALDAGLPWEDVTAAAARGVALRFAAREPLKERV